MKYEIKIAWYPTKKSKSIEQTITYCETKKKAYKIVGCIVKSFSSYSINYNCIELKKQNVIIAKIAIIEHLDKMQKRYGPFLKHLLVLGKATSK